MHLRHQFCAKNALDVINLAFYYLAKQKGEYLMTAVQVQNILIVTMIFGFAMMEFISRRYKATVRANSNDTKLEILMFISLLAIYLMRETRDNQW